LLALPGSRFICLSPSFTFPEIALVTQLHHHRRRRVHRSNLTLALQEKFPDAHLTVIDDFRSGDFKNLAGYRGDFVAENLATLDWREKFGDPAAAGFDAIFHLASITDTTLHDQFVQVHDNVESFRRL
jgi:ADP-L-glycero-D-manno-heptose 6-epimerase